MELVAQELMDALEGVAYVTDPDGRITACGRPGWDAFVADNGDSVCASSGTVVGQDLFASIEGEEVAARYRSWLAELAENNRGALTFQYRCDSPSLKREMRMSITRIGNARQLRGYLFHSTVLGVEQRPPLNIYDFASLAARFAGSSGLPLLRMCSFCQRVHCPGCAGHDEGEWVEAEKYYRTGGSSEVRISHGLCPGCVHRFETS